MENLINAIKNYLDTKKEFKGQEYLPPVQEKLKTVEDCMDRIIEDRIRAMVKYGSLIH